MNEEEIEQPSAQPKPVQFNRAKIAGMLRTADHLRSNPGGDFIVLMAEQLRLALVEIDGAQAKIDRAQSEHLAALREAETANAECRTLRAEMLALKSKPAPTPPKADDTPVVAPKKRGRPAKVVQLPEQKAQ